VTVKVGYLYTGWNKTWVVVAVKNGTAKIVDIEADYRTMTLPLAQFKEGRVS
jgi:hypothetical protein